MRAREPATARARGDRGFAAGRAPHASAPRAGGQDTKPARMTRGTMTYL